MESIENVRYLHGAPEEWSTWLKPESTVKFDMEAGGPLNDEDFRAATIRAQNVLVITSNDHQERIRVAQVKRFDVGSVEPPASGDTIDRSQSPLGPLRSPPGIHLLRSFFALTWLPPEPYRWLAISLPDGADIVFDVSDRTWAAARLLEEADVTSLEFLGDTRVLLKGLWRWICVSSFRISADHSTDGKEVLRALLENPAYWYDYVTTRSINPYRHGPYRRDALSVDSFRPVDRSEAISALTGWLNQEGPPAPDMIDGDLDQVFATIGLASECFELPDLGPQAHHEMGGILHSGFCELVLIGPDRCLNLVVASGD